MRDQVYHSFLLRLWIAHAVDGVVWRASLEEAHTGTRLGFSSIEQLHEFLLDLTDTTQSQPHACPPTDPASTVWPDDQRGALG